MGLGAFSKGIAFPIGTDLSGLKTGLSQASGELDKSQSKFGKFSATIKQHGMAIGAAMTGAGVAIIALTDAAKKTNASLMTTGIQLDKSTEEMRALALSTTNVTFPLSEVTKTFDLLARSGMKNTDEIKKSATAFDTLGDAIGKPASEVTATLIPAFNAFKIPLEDAAENTDTMTYLFRNSTIEMSDFSTVMNYLAADIGDLGISLDDTAGMLLAMKDNGVQGSAATREFRTAVTQASKGAEDYTADLEKLNNKIVDLKEASDDLTVSTRDTDLSMKENALSIRSAEISLQKLQKEGKGENETAEEYNIRLEEQKLRLEGLKNRNTDLIQKQKDLKVQVVENVQAQKDNAAAIVDTTKASLNQQTGTEKLYAALGITAEEVEKYKTKIEGAEGLTQKIADAQNTQYGTMDKLKQGYEEFSLSAGSTLEPLEGIGAALAAGGPMILGLTMMPGLLSAVKVGMTLISAHPIILALTLIIAALVILELKFGILTKAAEILSKGFAWLSEGVSAFIGWVTSAVDWAGVLGFAFKILLGPIGLVFDAITFLGENWETIWAGMESVVEGAASFIGGIFDTIVGGIKWAVNAVIDGVNMMIAGMNMLSFDIPDLFGGPPMQIGFDLPTIPRMAQGWIVTQPTIAMIGESGPEAVVPLTGAGGTGAYPTITGNTFIVREEADIDKIFHLLYDKIDRVNRGRGTT